MKNIFQYLSILTIIILFIIINIYEPVIDIENYDNIASSSQSIDLRLSNVEKKYDDIMNDISGINDRIIKYDNMYKWYQSKLDSSTVAAKEASANAQKSLSAGLNNPESNKDTTLSKSITGNLMEGANKSGDKDNKNSVNDALSKYSPPF